jgi:hypothetical protein
VWTTNSARTGGQFTADNNMGEQSTESDGSEEPSPLESHTEVSSPHVRAVGLGEGVAHLRSLSINIEAEPTAQKSDSPEMALAPPVLLEGTLSTDTVALMTPSKELDQDHDAKGLQEAADDDLNVTSLDREVWHSAPSTPMIPPRSD